LPSSLRNVHDKPEQECKKQKREKLPSIH
jgi:hypothetical protein